MIATSPSDLSQLNEATKLITEMTLKKYLIQQNDIRQCCAENCGYAGYILIDEETGNLECTE